MPKVDPRTAVREPAPLESASVMSAHDVPDHLLHDFYNTVYPGGRLPEIWRWWYRSSFNDNRPPLIVLHQQRVVAHAGIIPFRLSLAGETWNAAWFVDLAVLPVYQRHGLGTLLFEKWMEAALSDVLVAFSPTKKSIGLFRKYGWRESLDTRLHYFSLKPFDHPRLVKSIHPWVRRVLNIPMEPAMRLNHQRFAMPLVDLDFREPNERHEEVFVRPRGGPVDAVVRDTDWFRWRILSSPDRVCYRIFTLDGVTLLCKLANEGPVKSVDVLWVSDLARHDTIRRMIATLAVWARRDRRSYVRFLTSDSELSGFLSRSLLALVRRPRLMLFSKDPELLRASERARWDWQLIDSDFESF